VGQPPGVASGAAGAFVSRGDAGTAVTAFGFTERDGVDVTDSGEETAGPGSVVAADGAGGSVLVADGVTITGPPGGAGSGRVEPGARVRPRATAAITAPAGTGSQRHHLSGGRGAATVGGTPGLSRSCVI
jgi:hypothetical protein